MVDTLEVMASTTDAEFIRLLGVELDWTKFVGDVVLKRGMNGDSAMYEDMVTDIVTGILVELHNKSGQFAEKIAWCRATSHDDAALLNKLKPVMTAAVDFRLRDFRDRKSYNIGRHQMAIGGNEPTAHQHYVGSEMDADGLQTMIESELSLRFDRAVGMQRSVLAKSIAMLPDRIDGLGIREICEKHGWGRGKMVSLALKEIFNAVEAVATRLQESWMLTMIARFK